MIKVLQMSISRLFLLMIELAGSDLILNTIVLKDPVLFSVSQYETLLSTFSDSATVLSVQSDLLTGVVARRSYFPNNTDIHFFQLVHISRVKALVRTKNDTYTTARLYRSLGPACLSSGIGSVAIDTNTAVVDSSNAVMDWVASLPPLAMILMAVGWILTVSSCAVCWLVYCCCKSRSSAVPVAIAIPSAPPLIVQEPDENMYAEMPQSSAVSFKLNHHAMRLPVEMTQPQFSGQYGQYAAQTNLEGPSAMRWG